VPRWRQSIIFVLLPLSEFDSDKRPLMFRGVYTKTCLHTHTHVYVYVGGILCEFQEIHHNNDLQHVFDKNKILEYRWKKYSGKKYFVVFSFNCVYYFVIVLLVLVTPLLHPIRLYTNITHSHRKIFIRVAGEERAG